MQFLLAFWICVVVDIHTTAAAALDGGLSFVPWICFSVKVNEQNEEAHLVKADPYVECFGEIAFVPKEELEAMNRSRDELCDLEGSQVFLPPGKSFESGTHGCEQVVQVHDHVNEGIDESEKHGVTAANVASPRPDADG